MEIMETLEEQLRVLDEAATRTRPVIGVRVRRFAPGGASFADGQVIAVVDDEAAAGGYVVLCRFWYPRKRVHSFQLAEGRDWGRGYFDSGRRFEIVEKKARTK